MDSIKGFTRSKSSSIDIIHQFEKTGSGFSGIMDPITVEQVKNLPYVERVSPVQMMSVTGVQDEAPWGLARITHREKLGYAPYSFPYRDNGGEGVDVYVLDTGIYIQNEDFQGRAVWGITISQNSTDADIFGHGTHCAGTIAGWTYGVAKKARIIAVKVLGDIGGGPADDIIAGIEWVMKNADRKRNNIISMSLSGSNLDLGADHINEAVNCAIKDDIVTVVSAGNKSNDACLFSPASAKLAITVGATNITDQLASFSNYGQCVDILAPGVRIKSDWIGNTTATNITSGTSMATPHVAGLAAVLLSSGIKPKEVKSKLIELSTKNVINGAPKDTPNQLAYYPVFYYSTKQL